ncbi:hypothetical protein GW17_00029386 [Ensete ventricosum]|nr:hypothetical protein GW17_00029386 [Ensete ventricosum]
MDIKSRQQTSVGQLNPRTTTPSGSSGGSSSSKMFNNGLTQVFDSDCALSLLSAPTQTSDVSLSHMVPPADRIPMGQPLVSSLQYGSLMHQSLLQAPDNILMTFIEGLKLEICEEVKARQPYTLKAAISFAQQQEEQLNYEAWRTRVTPRPEAPKLSPPPTINRSPQSKKLIREDFHDGSTKEPKLEDIIFEPKEKDTPQPATRTVPTLAGYTNLQKLKIEGFLEQQSVIVLSDAGSTHNFMSSKIAAHLMLQKEDYNRFEVKVANDQILKCNRKCPRVKLSL